MEIIAIIVALALAGTADGSDTRNGYNVVKGSDGAAIFAFGANEEK